MSLFCRHNRYTADCPICSKGTVLDRGRRPARRSSGATRERSAGVAAPAAFSGRYVSAGPYEDEQGSSYDVRLERVPGGIRLAEWDGVGLRRRAPVLGAADLLGLVEGAAGVLEARDAARLAGALQIRPDGAAAQDREPGAGQGVSRGRSGDFQEELRVEPVGEDRVRIARWVLRPGSGWQLQPAPPMLPAARYAEAIADAARQGLLPSASDAGDPVRL